MDGVATPNGPVAIGELQLDALAIRGVPVQNLTGRFAILVIGFSLEERLVKSYCPKSSLRWQRSRPKVFSLPPL